MIIKELPNDLFKIAKHFTKLAVYSAKNPTVNNLIYLFSYIIIVGIALSYLIYKIF